MFSIVAAFFVMGSAHASFSVQSSSVQPSTVKPGDTFKLNVKLRSSNFISGEIVDFEFRDANHTKTYVQKVVAGQTFRRRRDRSFSYQMTVPSDLAAGDYCLDVGVFSKNFAALHFWQNCVSRITVAGVTPPPVPEPQPEPSAFKLGQRPFAATSSWNTPVSPNATFSRLNWPASTGYNYSVSWDAYSAAIFVASSVDPIVKVSYPPGWGYPGGTLEIRMPAAADGAPGTDGELVIIDGNKAHNFWIFKRTSLTTATAQSYGVADIVSGTGWGSKSPFLSAGITAAGSSQLAGILIQAETDAGEIQHALNIRTDFTLTLPGAVGEAIASDGGSATGIVREGQRLAIPPGTAMPAGLSPLGQKVFRAFQNYGAFVTDVSGGCSTIGAQQNAYDDATMTALWKDMLKVMPLLHAVK